MINISKYTKAQVLQALFNASKQKGAGFFEPRGIPTMTLETAQTLVEQSLKFNYLMDRVMNVDISKDSFDPWLYDRDNGEGAAEKALNSIETIKHLGTQNAPERITPSSDESKNMKNTEAVISEDNKIPKQETFTKKEIIQSFMTISKEHEVDFSVDSIKENMNKIPLDILPFFIIISEKHKWILEFLICFSKHRILDLESLLASPEQNSVRDVLATIIKHSKPRN